MKMPAKLSVIATILLSILSAKAQLPSVILKDLGGKNIEFSSLIDGENPTVFFFFSTQCRCSRALEAFNETYTDFNNETGVKLYGISLDVAQNSSKVMPFAVSLGLEFDVLLDTNGDLARSYNISYIPHILVFSGDGQLIDSHMGYSEGYEDVVMKQVRELSHRK